MNDLYTEIVEMKYLERGNKYEFLEYLSGKNIPLKAGKKTTLTKFFNKSSLSIRKEEIRTMDDGISNNKGTSSKRKG